MQLALHPSRAKAFADAVAADKPVPVKKAPDLVEQFTGVRPNPATVWRWSTAGCKGIRLATFLVGQRRYTKPSDVRTFLAATNGATSQASPAINQ